MDTGVRLVLSSSDKLVAKGHIQTFKTGSTGQSSLNRGDPRALANIGRD